MVTCLDVLFGHAVVRQGADEEERDDGAEDGETCIAAPWLCLYSGSRTELCLPLPIQNGPVLPMLGSLGCIRPKSVVR